MLDKDTLFTSIDTKGTEIVIGDLPVYAVGDGPKCIIFAYDIYGTHGSRTRFICDYIAAAGYKVYLPDFFRNTAWNAAEPFNDDFHFWIKLHDKYNVKEDMFQKLIPYAEEHGAKEFAIIGVHWGAFVVFNICSDKRFKCGISIDPAVHLSIEFHQQEMELYKSVVCPQLIIAAEDNHIIDRHNGEVPQLLKDKLGDEFKLIRVNGTKYGYFSAQNVSDEMSCNAIANSLQTVLDYISSHI